MSFFMSSYSHQTEIIDLGFNTYSDRRFHLNNIPCPNPKNAGESVPHIPPPKCTIQN